MSQCTSYIFNFINHLRQILIPSPGFFCSPLTTVVKCHPGQWASQPENTVPCGLLSFTRRFTDCHHVRGSCPLPSYCLGVCHTTPCTLRHRQRSSSQGHPLPGQCLLLCGDLFRPGDTYRLPPSLIHLSHAILLLAFNQNYLCIMTHLCIF